MPVPAFIGLSALFTAISSLVIKLVEWVFARFTKKIFIVGFVIAGAFLAINTLLSLIVTLLEPILDTLPTVTNTIGMALPANTQACISAVIAIELGCFAYSLTVKALSYQAKLA